MIYAMMMFFIGGLMVVISVPLSGLCLLMSDLDADLFTELQSSLELNVGAQGPMITEIVDRCVSVSAADRYHNQSSNLMDILKLENNGTSQSVREQVVTLAIQPVSDAFDEISAVLDKKPVRLSNVQELVKLRNILSATPISAMILPNVEQVRANTVYKDMTDRNYMSVALLTSMSCSNFDASNFLETDSQITGMDEMFSKLSAMGTPASSTCTATSKTQSMASCDSAQSTYVACQAANAFLTEQKNQLAASAVFKCSQFTNSLGAACDPKDMFKDASGEWHNICFNSDGELSIVEVSCNMADFQVYVQEFDQRLSNVFAYLDDMVASKLSAVNNGLRSVVTRNVLDPIYAVLDGFECDFMRTFYSGLLDGFCYQTTNGFRKLANGYVVSAIVALVITLAGFLVFRYSKDNQDDWDQRQKLAERQI